MFWAMAERQMMMVVMAAMTMRGSVMAWRWDPPFLSSVNDPALMIIQIIKIIITTLMMIFQTKVIIITIVVKLKSKDRQHIAKRLNLNQYLDAMRMQIWHIKKIQAKKTVHGQRDTCKQGHWPTSSGLGEARDLVLEHCSLRGWSRQGRVEIIWEQDPQFPAHLQEERGRLSL